jgi:hypothetical protein
MVASPYRVIQERGISELLFAATHYTHSNNILISNFKIIITESAMALSPASDVKAKNLCEFEKFVFRITTKRPTCSHLWSVERIL